MTTQARTPHVPAEILWGQWFRRLVAFHKEGGAYTIDFSLFNVTYAALTPKCSAKDLARISSLNTNIGTAATVAGESGGEDEEGQGAFRARLLNYS